MAQQSHRSDPRILNRRTLQRDHPRLLPLLRPGMSVLDVGCGTGAITAGIARIVGPNGYVMGLDRDESLVELARREHHAIQNLSFESGDALSMSFENRFDIVTAARTLQWISQPQAAVARMKNAARSGGRIVVLDYNHANNSWQPDPPIEFKRFYEAFLNWRRANSWNNVMADCLSEIFLSEGLRDVQVYIDDEITERGDPDFFDAAAIWTQVIQSVGSHIVAAGFLCELKLLEAEHHYQDWVQSCLRKQTLEMRTVEGTIPIIGRPLQQLSPISRA